MKRCVLIRRITELGAVFIRHGESTTVTRIHRRRSFRPFLGIARSTNGWRARLSGMRVTNEALSDPFAGFSRFPCASKRAIVQSEVRKRLVGNMSKKRTFGRCVICGTDHVAVTRDHIPPKGFFSPPRPNNCNLITVLACDICNCGTSQDDEWFKVIAEIVQLKTSEGTEVNFRPTLEQTLRGSVHISKTIRNSFDRIFLPTGPLGGFEENFFLNIDYRPFFSTCEKIVKGIFYEKTGKFFSDGYEIRMTARTEIQESDVLQSFFYDNHNSFTKQVIVAEEFAFCFLPFELTRLDGMIIVLNFLGSLEVYAAIRRECH